MFSPRLTASEPLRPRRRDSVACVSPRRRPLAAERREVGYALTTAEAGPPSESPPTAVAREQAREQAGEAAVPGATASTIGWSAAGLTAELDGLAAVDLDALDREALRGLLVDLTGPLRRLEAARSAITGRLHTREHAAHPTSPAAGERATRDFLTGELGLAPGEAKDLTATARRLPGAPHTRDAYQAGALTSQQTSIIAACLDHIAPERRTDVEAHLIALAATSSPAALGRAARRLIAENDPRELGRLERRQHLRRHLSYHHTPHGALRLSGELYGTDAETVRTALDAFTATPTSDDHRSHDQRRADGLTTMANAALSAGTAPSQHGVRPHVLLLVDAAQLAAHRAGGPAVAVTGSGQPATLAHLNPLLADCHVTRIALDASRAPVEASHAVRTVPTALWRALQARDQGCTWAGCTAPPAWCDVAHLATPYAAGGRLTLETAALLCRHHHRRYDSGRWTATINGDTTTYHHTPDKPDVTALIRQHRRTRGDTDTPPGDGEKRRADTPQTARTHQRGRVGRPPDRGIVRPPLDEAGTSSPPSSMDMPSDEAMGTTPRPGSLIDDVGDDQERCATTADQLVLADVPTRGPPGR